MDKNFILIVQWWIQLVDSISINVLYITQGEAFLIECTVLTFYGQYVTHNGIQ